MNTQHVSSNNSLVLPTAVDTVAEVRASDRTHYIVAQRALEQGWLDEPNTVNLFLVYCFERSSLHQVLVSDRVELQEKLMSMITGADFTLAAFAKEEQVPLLEPNTALRLSSLSIPKPWGHEIWYTGVEQRGVCEVETLAANCPLPWLQAALVGTYSGLDEGASPVLLKVLDPHPEPVLGDLYFELHEVKQEVYVITSIDQHAWPAGVGQIRIGFNPAVREQYASEAVFKAAFASAVHAYRVVRLKVDEWLDEHCPQHQAVLSLEQAKSRLAGVPAALAAEEQRRRVEMEAYTHLHELRVGDVVTIPRCLPHALQHGVRAVEFQTPVYERKIVSFAQKVLTQSHWDTEEALALCSNEEYQRPDYPSDQQGDCRRQRIVEFDDFEVWRCELAANRDFTLQGYGAYQLLMPIGGSVQCGEALVKAEQAVLLLASAHALSIRNADTMPVSFLLACPRAVSPAVL